MKRRPGLWIAGFFVLVLALLIPVAVWTVRVDPFFHYHKPDTDAYYYVLDNQRSQNDGIMRHFDYTGMIIGTSLTENFKTSEAEALFGGQFIKVPFSGATFREINENIESALQRNPELRTVIRGMESWRLLKDKDVMREDMGDYPTYLYDDDPLNDVEYLFNRDVMFDRIYSMCKAAEEPDFVGGITSFDRYSNWSSKYPYGKNALFPDGIDPVEEPSWIYPLNEKYQKMTLDNVTQNLTDIADAHPDVTFYYFFAPYSAKFFMDKLSEGTLDRMVASERVAIEEILRHPNIRLYSFNDQFDLTMDLNNYKDYIHYGEWVNSLILRDMQEGKCLLTADNYEAYLDRELTFYKEYDYSLLAEQEDYDVDAYAALLLAERTGVQTGEAVALGSLALRNAALVPEQYEGGDGILCTGRLGIDFRDRQTVLSDYLRDTDYIGAKLTVEDIEPYSLIAFYGRKLAGHGQPTVYVYDEAGNAVAACRVSYRDINGDAWQQYVVDVSRLRGPATVIFHGGYIDTSGDPDSQFVFSRITLF